MTRILFGVLTTLVVCSLPRAAAAFDYLEHSYFADRACLEAQKVLARQLADRDSGPLLARYLALALVCPDRWDGPYCADDYRQVQARINDLADPPSATGEHSLTLGDLAALPDHLSRAGPVKGYPRAGEDGITARVFEWLAEHDEGADGVIADVGEDACETDGLVDWTQVEGDIDTMLSADEVEVDVPSDFLVPGRRAPVPPGPEDPDAAYSFDNPHFLDLVLGNHHHFGSRAWEVWLGYHAASTEILTRSCVDAVPFDADFLEDLADEAELDGRGGDGAGMGTDSCALLRTLVERRVMSWLERAEPTLVAPAAKLFAELDKADKAELLDATVVALMSLVVEGTGIHYLQDTLSGGHVRYVRESSGSLAGARYEHDVDGATGVAATVRTATDLRRFVAFGDGRLLAIAPASPSSCAWPDMHDPDEVTACLLRVQRALVVRTVSASLLDWALGGSLYASGSTTSLDRCLAEAAVAQPGPEPQSWVCTWLPMSPPSTPGQLETVRPDLPRGDLPVPPPPFDYESLLVALAVDGAGDGTQLGARLVLLSALGSRANWMTSYDTALYLTTSGDTDFELQSELAYMFHWRWAARFLVSAGPMIHGGLRSTGDDVDPFAGIGPRAGISVLPEGWLKIPLELTASYRLPLTLFDAATDETVGFSIEAHWIELAVGLAFL